MFIDARIRYRWSRVICILVWKELEIWYLHNSDVDTFNLNNKLFSNVG